MSVHATPLRLAPGTGWQHDGGTPATGGEAQLVLVFGPTDALRATPVIPPLRSLFPAARIVVCSTQSAILGDAVHEEAITAMAVRFDHTRVEAAMLELPEASASTEVGAALARALPADGLRHVLLISDGLDVNGSALARGLASALPAGVTVSGGLAADGERFASTLVGLDAEPLEHVAVAVGLYGDRLAVGLGSVGGWTADGAALRVTRAEANVVHSLDDEPALVVYKRRLGAHAYALPASGLLYPLRIPRDGEAETRAGGEEDATGSAAGLVRTLLGVDEGAGTLTFAGDVPEGTSVRMMRASLDELIEASGAAARRAASALPPVSGPTVALLISCIGRRLLLQRRVHEEIASARRAMGADTAVAGFYSYGELSPAATGGACELHNQTMTVTLLGER